MRLKTEIVLCLRGWALERDRKWEKILKYKNIEKCGRKYQHMIFIEIAYTYLAKDYFKESQSEHIYGLFP